jgi:AcrR family transcriptional regulator
MSDVAREAGVAKSTVFHRFGDRQALAQALVGDAERALQEDLLRGPPPLGPGAPPREPCSRSWTRC